MRQAWAGLAVVLGFLAWTGAASAADDPPTAPSYTNNVKPFLAAYCMNCHSGSRARSGVSVDSLADLMKGRRALVVPEKPDDSRLMAVLTGRGRQMPPRRAPQPKADEIAKVHDWIAAGARDDTPVADDDKKTPADSGK